MTMSNQDAVSPGKAIWHIALDLDFEGGENDSCQEGVQKVLSVLEPLIQNGSGIKRIFVTRLPEKDWR